MVFFLGNYIYLLASFFLLFYEMSGFPNKCRQHGNLRIARFYAITREPLSRLPQILVY